MTLTDPRDRLMTGADPERINQPQKRTLPAEETPTARSGVECLHFQFRVFMLWCVLTSCTAQTKVELLCTSF